MKKKHVKAWIIAIIILLFFIIGIIMRINNKQVTDKVKKAVEDLGCIYYYEKGSDEENFNIDVYISIPYEPVDNNGRSNQYYYEKIIKTLTTVIEYDTFRIIDSDKNIIIRAEVKDKNVNYTINGTKKFFDNELATINKKNNLNKKEINLSIASSELEKISQNEWNRSKSKSFLGSVDKVDEEYDCYIDEGYKIKTRNLKIFNIVFTNQYKQELFNGITTGMTNQEIRKILGNPLFINDMNGEINGYITSNYYVFFCNGEISIYPIQKYDEEKNNKFAQIIDEIEKDGNTNKFLNDLTELYPTYDEYKKTDNLVEIKYSNLGMKVDVDNGSNKYRITLNSNYKGNIDTKTTISDVENGNNLPKNIYISNLDGIFEVELKRSR